MNLIASFIIPISGGILLFACNHKSKTNPIVGKWQFEKAENKDKTEKDVYDINKRSEGVVATFYDDRTFVSIKKRDNYTDTLAKGTYEMSQDGKFLLTQEPDKSEPDTVKIIEVTDKILKVHPPGEKDILILKRIH